MENPGGGFDEEGEPNTAPVRWVAPVDPITGEVDARLCFLYADLWRRVMSPETEELEPLQAWGGEIEVEMTGPPVGSGKVPAREYVAFEGRVRCWCFDTYTALLIMGSLSKIRRIRRRENVCSVPKVISGRV